MSGYNGYPSREAWLDARREVVGASEVAALFNVQADYALSHYALWMVKAGRVPAPDVNGLRPVWGLRLESAIADAAAEQECWTIRKGGHIADTTTPGMACTLDFIVDADPAEQGPGCLECKNVDWLVHKKTWTEGEPPIHILLQLQHQLACTGYQWGAVVCLVGGNDMRIYRYKARPKLIGDIRQRVTAFWRSIEEDKPPPVDGSDGASAVLRALYASPVDEEADLSADNEMPEICSGYLTAVEARKAAKKREDEYKNRLVAKLGPHLRARCQGFRVSTAITPEKASRAPLPGEMIAGRAEARRYTVKEWVE